MIVVATADHTEHGFYLRGHFYEVVEQDTKRNTIKVIDERGEGCWYTWENFVKMEDFNDTMRTREIRVRNAEQGRKIEASRRRIEEDEGDQDAES